VALKKIYFSTVYQFWKQQYFNQNGSDLVVKDVICSYMVLGSNSWKNLFSQKKYLTRQKGRD